MRTALVFCTIATLVFARTPACDAQAASGRAASAPQLSTRDSSGVEIVELSGDMLNGLPLWRFADQPALSIGVADGEAPYLFSNINAARRLSTGAIVVIDGASRELRVFAADGRFVRKYGGRGQGPGEFGSSTLNVSEMDGTTISIFDGSRNSVTTMNVADGKFATSALPPQCRESGTAALAFCEIARPLADGTAFRTRSAGTNAQRGANLTITGGRILRYGLVSGDILRVVDSVTTASAYSKGTGADYFSGQALYEPGSVTAYSASEIAFGDPRRFEIRIRRSNGSLRQIIRVKTAPVTSTRAMLDAVRRYADSAHARPEVMEYIATLQAGTVLPSFGQLRIDRAGRVWIAEYQPPPWLGPRAPVQWTILSARGAPIARVVTPANISIMELGDDYMLGLSRDSLGVESVRMYQLNRQPR